MSQEEFASHTGIHRTYMSAIERGWKNPSFTYLRRIAEGLEVAPSKLLMRAEKIEKRGTDSAQN